MLDLWPGMTKIEPCIDSYLAPGFAAPKTDGKADSYLDLEQMVGFSGTTEFARARRKGVNGRR